MENFLKIPITKNIMIKSRFRVCSYLNYFSPLKKSFTEVREKKYKALNNYNPDPEVLRFYKQYLEDNPNMPKSHYENLLNSKLLTIKKLVKKEDISNTIDNYDSIEQNKRISLELKEVLKIILSKISVSKESDLQKISEYHFKQEGKLIRPHLIISFSKYLYECEYGLKNDYFNSTIHQKYVLPFSAGVEVLHNASLLHDDIIDNSDMRRNRETAHNLFGIRNTVFVPHYIISKAANLINELESNHLNEIYSAMVYYLTYGEIQQSLHTYDVADIDKAFEVHMLKTYYKTASLLALALRGLGIIYKLDESIQLKLFNLGLHIGIVFQLVDDLIDVESINSQKPKFKDLDQGIINSYLLYQLQDEIKKGTSNELLEIARRKMKNEGDISKVINIMNSGNGILKTQNLSMDHLLECYKILDFPYFKFSSSKYNIYQYLEFVNNRKY